MKKLFVVIKAMNRFGLIIAQIDPLLLRYNLIHILAS